MALSVGLCDDQLEPVVEDDQFDILSSGVLLNEFKESKELIEIIESLQSLHHDLILSETAIEKFTIIVDKYQEQPHLLDRHLEVFINLILAKVRNKHCSADHAHLLFKCLYLLTKMRGYKVIIRWLPHEVADVEPVLDMLYQQNPDKHENWEVKYCLLLWLSMVTMIPFDLSRLDNALEMAGGDRRLPAMDRILNITKVYLRSTDKSRDAAAFALAKILTRQDVRNAKMSETINWALHELQLSAERGPSATPSAISDAFSQGILFTLALLFKKGKREDLIPYANRILDAVTRDGVIQSSTNTVIRKLGVKLIQRIGLVYLKAKIAAWRYSRGSRTLAINLQGSAVASTERIQPDTVVDESYNIPDEIEEVIGQLLITLKDKDTIVRWSAAKGIGRVSGRLPQELADDILTSLLDLFTFHEMDGAWHGGCLALAELGRRGLLLPQRLPEVIPVILKALHYDEKRGNFSVGAHVRDAACYVCWSFARAYDPSDLLPYVKELAGALVIVSVFDREVNVRRAASAAFQENVGRQGTFPHGIEILTTCDYYSVSNRTRGYLQLSSIVAQFPEYTEALIDHLVEVKVSHWDANIRQLTSKALHKLAAVSPSYMAEAVLPRLVVFATGTDLNTRHGAILALGQICFGLYSHTKDITLVKPAIIEEIILIESKLRSRKQLLGLGGELMRQALCDMISNLSRAHLPLMKHPVIGQWQGLIDECLQYVEEDVQHAAVEAIPHFVLFYEAANGSLPSPAIEDLLGRYTGNILHASAEAARIGFSLALGSLPESLLAGKLSMVLSALIFATKIGEKKQWADARRNTWQAIDRVCCKVPVTSGGLPDYCICASNLDLLFNALLEGMNDYTVDSRGDVGAWVREACMSCWKNLINAVVTGAPSLLTKEHMESVFPTVAQQACEKIDRTRALAGSVFVALLYHQPELPHVPHQSELQAIFPRAHVNAINFAAPSETFALFCQLLDLPLFTYHVMLGLAISVGGLTESLVQHSQAALLSYLNTIKYNMDKLKAVCNVILRLYSNYYKVDRVSLPLLKMTRQLLTCGVFEPLVDDKDNTFSLELLEAVKKECFRSTDPQKLMSSSDVMCGLLVFPGLTREKALVQLSIHLCHHYPRIRKATANQLFEALITNDELLEESDSAEAMSILSDTVWDDAVETLKPIRNHLCNLLHIPCPVVKKKPVPGACD